MKNKIELDLTKLVGIEFAGINHWDSPKYCDAYISQAFCSTPGGSVWKLNESELNWLNDQSDFVHKKLEEFLSLH